MNKLLGAGVMLSSLLLSACVFGSKGLTVSERQLLDVRHDHLRCEVKLDRLRHLYQVTPEEGGGLMDDELEAGNEMGDPTFDAPLTGGHDAPLTGGHDAPLTGGHDAPLTGGHDYADALRGAILESANDCWDTVFELVDRYNQCVVDFLQCRDDGDLDCLDPRYNDCLISNRP